MDNTQSQIAGFHIAHRTDVLTGPVKTSLAPEIELEGPTSWLIGGQVTPIDEVVLIDFRGSAMLAIKVSLDYPDGMSEQIAHDLAAPIAGYAVDHGYEARARAAAEPAGLSLQVDTIGVALIRPGTRKGYRVQVPIAELHEGSTQPSPPQSAPTANQTETRE